MKQIHWKPLIISLAISLGTGGISAWFTRDGMDLYTDMLYKPPLSPPAWLFPIVWTILYILMGIAAYRVYISDAEADAKKSALIYYGVQLIFNFGWTLIFFRWQMYLLAFVWLLLLWYLIFVTMRKFYVIDPIAGYLMVPYLLWVTFAGYLNLAIAMHYIS